MRSARPDVLEPDDGAAAAGDAGEPGAAAAGAAERPDVPSARRPRLSGCRRFEGVSAVWKVSYWCFSTAELVEGVIGAFEYGLRWRYLGVSVLFRMYLGRFSRG